MFRKQRHFLPVALVVFAVALAGCAQAASSTEGTPTAEAPPDDPPEAPTVESDVESEVSESDGGVPMMTPADACVPAEEIYLDTFGRGTIRFSEAPEADILRLRDAIPPITNPRYEEASGGDWLGSDGMVLGYADGDEAYAYPFQILNFHEIVNEDINGKPVLISYCPLCRSGVVYSRVLNGETLTFGNTSALYESDLVMYDHQTGSYWHQVGGVGIVGPNCERRLDVLPSITTTWGEWQTLYPDTLILSRDTGYDAPYERDPFANYASMVDGGQFAFPVSEKGRDSRLNPAELVLGVEIDGARRAYPLTQLGDAVVADSLGGREFVVFSSAEGPGGAAYFSQADGRPLSFGLFEGAYLDQETQSVWDLSGRAIDGPLAGTALEPVPTRTTFWFALVASFPEIEVYAP